ncbi:hypothetical protein HYU21_04620 [Candidatus Woesearchaeota archaeon]|nr:hypothetical protein [Candidatus Woesearchaeota archaeon]
MKVRTTRIILHFVLLFMNAGFVLYTLQRQGSFELYYNILTVLLTIGYFVLEMPINEES